MYRWCAWYSNPGSQDEMAHRQINLAIAGTLSFSLATG